MILLLLYLIPLLFIKGRHSRGSPVGEEAPPAGMPRSKLVKHAALLVLIFLVLLSGGLGARGGVAGVEPAAPGPRPPLRLVVDAHVTVALPQMSRLLPATVQLLFLLLF